MSQSIATGANGGKHVNGAPLTTGLTEQLSPDLLRNSVDERIVRIRPASTPIDQISRCGGSRSAGAMKVDFYSVDTRPTESETSEALAAIAYTKRGEDSYTFKVRVKNAEYFQPTETVLLPGVTVKDQQALVAYVVAVEGNTLELQPVNCAMTEGENGPEPSLASLPKGTRLIRMGRAATELDVQSPSFQSLPVKAMNYCQIFKMQIEQSTLQKLADKEVGWSFSDQEEAAVIDMRMGMEKNFLFGSAAKITDPVKGEEVYLTGGIWNQTSNSMQVQLAQLSQAKLIEIAAKAFTGKNGSKAKLLIGGTKFIEALSKIAVDKVADAGRTMVKWGVEFREIRTNFGSFFVLHSEVFDQCSHAKDAFVLDPDYVTKYTHIPFRLEKLDLRSAGTRNTDAVVLTEASCLVLRFPQSHLKLIGQ